MGFNYARSQATASRLIAKFGMTGAIVRLTKSGPSYDPTVTEASHACVLVDLDYKDTLIDGSNIKRGDRMVYVAMQGLDIVPSVADKITINTVQHAIISVKPLSPAGLVVFYEIQARK